MATSVLLKTAQRSVLYRLAVRLARVIPVPVIRWFMEQRFMSLGVEPTNICNARCKFCGYRFMKRSKGVMSMDLFERAIEEFVVAGGGSLNFTPTVGEPFVDKQLLEKIRIARAHSAISQIFLYTNAINLHLVDTDQLLTSGLSRLAISTYFGGRDGYVTNYGTDKYDQVIRNIRRIGRRNEEMGHPVQLTLHLRVPRDLAWRKQDEYQKIVSLIGEEYVDYVTEYDTWGGRISDNDIPDGCSFLPTLPESEKLGKPCFELYRRVQIRHDGRIGTCVCVDLDGEITIGDLRKPGGLLKQWRGKEIRSIRDGWKRGTLPHPCLSCTRYQFVDDYIRSHKESLFLELLRRTGPGRLLFRVFGSR